MLVTGYPTGAHALVFESLVKQSTSTSKRPQYVLLSSVILDRGGSCWIRKKVIMPILEERS